MFGYPFQRICSQLLGDEHITQWYAACDQGKYLPQHVSSYCPRCGASIGKQAVTPKGCAFCIHQKIGWQHIVRVSSYTPPISDWILSLKFKRAWRWGNMLGQLLIPHLAALEIDNKQVAVCSVPMHWYRRWERGFNQAHLIAGTVGKHFNWPVVPLLHRSRYTPPQTRVIPSQRPVNVSRSVASKKIDLKDWTVVLVDDVKTSGATLNNCCKELKAMGCNHIIAAVIAVADLKNNNFKTVVPTGR